MNILGIGRDKSQSAYFSGSHQMPEYEMERGHRAARLGPCQGVVWLAQAPHRPHIPPIYCPRDENPKGPIKNPRKSL